MKKTLLGALVCVAVTGSWATAQYYGGAYVNNKASTVGESRARGIADVARSRGMANLANSEAAINMTEVARRDMENREQWTDTYFSMRQKNQAYRAAEKGPRPTREDFARYAAAGKPARLSPSDLDSVNGDIDWPTILTRPEFDKQRAEMDDLFTKRAATGGSTWKDYSAIADTTKAMQETLKGIIKDVPPQEYMVSRKFLESLAYENKQPAG